MANNKYFHFKAATGSGAIIDGAATAQSPRQISRMLLGQGLIPVRIWSDLALDNKTGKFSFRHLGRYLIGRWRAAH